MRNWQVKQRAYFLQLESPASNNKRDHLPPKIRIRKAVESDIPEILEMIDSEARLTGALLPVSRETLEKWVEARLSYVAVCEGVIAGHEAVNVWPESGWIELRSLIVKKEYRGMGIGGRIGAIVLRSIKRKYKSGTIIDFTNRAGAGKRMLLARGFKEISVAEVPKELLTIGPKYRGQAEFGYRVFLLKF